MKITRFVFPLVAALAALVGLSAFQNKPLVFHPASPHIALWRPYGFNQPALRVCIDKDPCRTIAGSAPMHSGTALQPHFITLDHVPKQVLVYPEKGDTSVKLTDVPADAPVLGAGMHEDDSPGIRYDGSWAIQKREGPSDSRVHTAVAPDSSASFTFDGAALEIGMAQYDDRRLASVCIDRQCHDVGLFSHALNWQQPMFFHGLKKGRHHVRVQWKNGKAFDIDWIRIFDAPPAFGKGTYPAPDPRFVYGSGWQDGKAPGTKTALNRTAGMGFSFTGKWARLSFQSGPNAGEIEVCTPAGCATHDLFSFESGVKAIEVQGAPAGKPQPVTIRKGRSRQLDFVKLRVL